MLKLNFFAVVLMLGSPAMADDASPIPDDAETRFCYYAGLAYSKNAYIIVSSGNSRTQQFDTNGALRSGGETRSETEGKLLHCVSNDDGSMGWSSEAAILINR